MAATVRRQFNCLLSLLDREELQGRDTLKKNRSKICMAGPRSFPRVLLLQRVPPQPRRLIALSPPTPLPTRGDT